jgi:hypothetical protein
VLGEDVGALVGEGLGGVRLLARIVPGIDPDDADLQVGPDGLGAEHEGVDAGDDLGNGEGADIADGPGLRHAGGDLPEDVAPLVEAAGIGGEIGRPLVAGGVLETDVGMAAGDALGRVHEAEGGGEDQPVAGAASCSMTRSASGPSATFSTKVVSTRLPNWRSTAWRATSC